MLDKEGKLIPENPAYRKHVLETEYSASGLRLRWTPCRPVPNPDGWFETVWKEYRTGEVYGAV